MKKKLTLNIHRTIILVGFILNIVGFFVFFLVLDDAGIGILFRKANTVDFTFLVIRRIASILTWIAFSGLTVYLGVTEIFPKRIEGKFVKRWAKLAHRGIILNYIIAIMYSVHQLIVIAFEDRLQHRIIKLMYIGDLGIILLGLLLYCMFLNWVPNILYHKYKIQIKKEHL